MRRVIKVAAVEATEWVGKGIGWGWG